MKNHFLSLLAFAAGAAAGPAAAETQTFLSPQEVAYHEAAMHALATSRASDSASIGTAGVKAMGDRPLPGTPEANRFRAYPPSCASYPLPNKASGPTLFTGVVPLYALSAQGAYIENVSVTVWRVACSGGRVGTPYAPNGTPNAITLIRFDRAADVDHKPTAYPTLPFIQVSQGNISFDDTTKSHPRVADEPNTVAANVLYGAAMIDSTTYVLENFPNANSSYFFFNQAFKLRINPFLQNVAPTNVDVPAFAPTQETYPDAFAGMPITGYFATAWSDPTHLGEGIQTQVYVQADGARVMFLSWFTYDTAGMPFWIVAQGTFQPGAKSVVVDASYQTDGGFAGDFGNATSHPWGTLEISFPSCDTMRFTFDGHVADQTSGPSGSGSREWKRLADVNGLTCE